MDETELADELITLAGKFPSDLAETLSRNPEVVRLLRSVGNEVYSGADWRSLFSGQSPQEPPGELGWDERMVKFNESRRNVIEETPGLYNTVLGH